jgi:hypothetical protein
VCYENSQQGQSTKESRDAADVPLRWLLSLVSPAGMLCAAWRGDVPRQDGSKDTRADSENLKARKTSDDLESILVKASWCFNFLLHFTFGGLSEFNYG